MLVAYDSMSGNVKRFVGKLGVDAIQIHDGLVVDEPYYLVTYTIGFGQVPGKTARFLKANGQRMLGVASSGNRNWGDTYCRAADLVSAQYGVPILHKFELSGTVDDVDIFMQEVGKCLTSQNG